MVYSPKIIPQDVTISKDKNNLRSSVLCLQTSLYRSLWAVYQVYRPLSAGRPSGLGNQGTRKVYRSPIAGAKFADLSLQITPYKLFRLRNKIYLLTFNDCFLSNPARC